jgi:carboxyl-terminal processing protease
MMKKHLLIILLTVGIITGCENTNEPQISKSTYSKDFETIWQNYDRYYVFFDYKKIDWTDIYSSYSSQVAKDSNYDDFISDIKNMLAPLKDVHVWIQKSNGQFVQTYSVPTYFPSHIVNWDKGIWQKNISAYNWHQESSSWGWFKQDSIGYIAISSWNKDEILLQDFDTVLDSMYNCKGIIIDIRMNGGGWGPLAGSIGGRFVTDKFNCGYIQYRNGPKHSDFTSMAPLEYPKRGNWQFTKTIILLIGRGCFSTSEIFSAGMTKLQNCITVGDTTGGGLSNSRQFNLSDGTVYSVSDQLIFDTDGKIVEWNGIPPRVVVSWNLNDVKNGKDPVFNYALNLLKSN